MTKILWESPVGTTVFEGDTLALVEAVRRGGFEPVVGLAHSKVGGYESPLAA